LVIIHSRVIFLLWCRLAPDDFWLEDDDDEEEEVVEVADDDGGALLHESDDGGILSQAEEVDDAAAAATEGMGAAADAARPAATAVGTRAVVARLATEFSFCSSVSGAAGRAAGTPTLSHFQRPSRGCPLRKSKL
jgi:hypothetical protein